MLMEQSQTNFSHRSQSRTDVRLVSGSTTLSEVDCGKFLVLKLVANTSLTLPVASSCIGCRIEGMIVENTGGFSLAIAGDNGSSSQLVGCYGEAALNVDGTQFGPVANAPVGMTFTFFSTGTKWCIRVSGSRAPINGAINFTFDSGDVPPVDDTPVDDTPVAAAANVIITPTPPNLVLPPVINLPVTTNPKFIQTFGDLQFDMNDLNASVVRAIERNLRLTCKPGKRIILDGALEVSTAPRFSRRKFTPQIIGKLQNTVVTWPDASVSYPIKDITSTADQKFIANTDGMYLVTWTVNFGSSSVDADLSTFVTVLGSPATFGKVTVPGSPRPVTLSSSVLVFLAAGSHVSVLVFHTFANSISVPSVQGTSTNFDMQLTMVKQL